MVGTGDVCSLVAKRVRTAWLQEQEMVKREIDTLVYELSPTGIII